MKKRSLFAAVAMLIVSAIVLTSATYAWFVVGTQASITGITAQVASASSGVQVRRYDNGNAWSSTINFAALGQDENNSFPSTYIPATAYVNTSNAFSCLSGAFDATNTNQINVTTGASAGTDYAKFQVKIRTTGDTKNVKLVPTITNAEGSTDANKALKVAVQYNNGTSDQGVLGVFGDEYSAIKTAGTYLDTNADFYITDADGDSSPYASALQAQTITSATDGVVLTGVNNSGTCYITVYMWIEGNDAECTNALSSQIANVSFTLDVVNS